MFLFERSANTAQMIRLAPILVFLVASKHSWAGSSVCTVDRLPSCISLRMKVPAVVLYWAFLLSCWHFPSSKALCVFTCGFVFWVQMDIPTHPWGKRKLEHVWGWTNWCPQKCPIIYCCTIHPASTVDTDFMAPNRWPSGFGNHPTVALEILSIFQRFQIRISNQPS